MANKSKSKPGNSGNGKGGKWLKNAIRSMGSASVVTFKSITPNISSTAAGAKQASKVAASQITKIKKQNVGKIARKISQNQYVKVAKKAFDEGKRDLKTGNLYNPNRATESMTDSQFGDFDGFDDFEDWADDVEGNVTFNYIDNDSSDGEIDVGSSMVAQAITENGRNQIKASQATVDAFIGVSSETINVLRDGFAETGGRLDAINSTLTAILDYHQENTTNFYNAALAAFERIGSAVDSNDFGGPKEDITDIFSSSGGINPDGYKKYLKSKLKKVVDESPAGAILPFLKEPGMVEALVSDPIGGLTKGLVGGMLPKVVAGTLQEVDKTFGNLIPNMMVNISKWVDSNEGGIKGTIKKWIGSIFGIDVKTNKHLNMQEVTKDAATFDQITRNSIVEVLPKYARESTAYLREIAMHITHTKKKDKDKLLETQEIFDTRTNSYKSTENLTKELSTALEEAVTSAFSSTEFGKVLSGVGEQLNSKDKKEYEKTLNQFFVQLANSRNMSAADYNIGNKNSQIHDVLKRTGGSKRDRKLLVEAIKRMYTDNIAIDSAARGQISAQSAWNQQLKEMSENGDIYNLHALGIDNETDILEFIEKRQKNGAAKSVRIAREREQKKKDKESEEYDDSIKKKFKSAKNTVSDAIDAYQAGAEYQKEQDTKKYGKIADSVFGENIGQGFKQAGSHAMNGMFMIMKGDANAAVKEFSSIFTDQIKNVWTGMNDHFFSPLGKRLFGDKEKDGEDGIFGGSGKKLSDIKKAFFQKIDGKDYTDSKGVVHKKEDDEESLVDKATSLFTTVKEGIFGKKKDDNGQEKDGEGGIFKTFTKSIREGLTGWREAIFGEDEDPEKNGKLDKEKMKKAILDSVPSAIMGSAGGAMLGVLSHGSLLGMLVGGPVGGAVVGFAGSLLMRSNRFKDYLFGPEVEETDENGNTFKRRVGGLISEKTQKFFKDNKSSIAGGAVLGAIKNMVFPKSFGLLSSVVGGPIAGAAVGIGFSLLKKSDMWQKFLYGDEEKGKQGVVTAFKSLFSGEKKDKNDKDISGARKMLGMGAIGGAGGALTAAMVGKVGLLGAMLTPGGLIGGALLGTAVGIAAGGNRFSKWLFGEKDPETKERKGGMVQKFGNFMHTEVFAPMKSKMQNILDDMKTTVKYDILEHIRLPFVAAADSVKKHFGNVKDAITQKIDDFAMNITEKWIKPITGKIKDFIFKPIRTVVSKATDIVYNSAKMAITLPFKLVGKTIAFFKNGAVKLIGKIGKGIFKGIHGVFSFVKAGISRLVFRPLGKVIGGIASRVANFFRKRKDKKAEKGGGLFSKAKNGFNTLRAKLTDDSYKKEYLQNKVDRAKEIAENKKRATQRSQRDYNRAKMASVLGYDVKYFTKENFELAKKMAKEQKTKIKWRGNVDDLFEEDKDEQRRDLMKKSTAEIAKNADKSEDVQVRQLGEQHRTNEILERIAEQNGISQERAQELWDELREERQEEAERSGVDYDEETGEVHVREEGNNQKKEKLSARIEREMDEQGGIRNYLKYKWNGLKSDVKEGYEGSWLDSKLSRFKSPARSLKNFIKTGYFKTSDSDETSEEYEEQRSDFESHDHARASGGPVKKGEPYLVGDGGSDPSAAEIIIPNSSGKVLSQKDGGIKVYVTKFSKDALNDLNGGEDGKGFGFPSVKTSKKSYSFEDAIEEFTSKIVPDGPKEKLTDVKELGRYDKLKEKADKIKEDEEDDARAEKTNSILGQILEKNEEHQSIWSTIFSKKGILTAGLTVAGGLLITHIPEIAKAVPKIVEFGKDLFDALVSVATVAGKIGAPVVNAVSSGIGKLTSMVPFLPTIEPPKITAEGPLAGLATIGLGGLYLKGISAVGSVAAAAATLISKGANLVSNLPGGLGTVGKAVKYGSMGLAAYSYLKGPETHENTDAAGNEIVDTDKTRGMRSAGTKYAFRDGIIRNVEKVGGVNRQPGIIKRTVTSAKNKIANTVSNKLATESTGIIADSRNKLAKKITTKLSSGADDVATSRGAMGFVKKCLTGVKNFLMKNKTLKKFATVISTKIDDLLLTIGKASDSIVAKMPSKISSIITKGTAKDSVGAATAGLSYAVMAFGGALSGGLSAANIFGVREADVNGTMRTIASIVVALLNAVPCIWALELVDLFIAPTTFRGWLCENLYNLLGGGEDLEEKRTVFANDLIDYNSKYGTELDTDEYNDMVNKSAFAKIFGKGSVKTDENGRAMFDEAGAAIRTNHGIAGWFSSGQKVYEHNADGSVMRDEKGKAIQAVDKYGRKRVEKKTWTDHIGDKLGGIGRFFAGGDEYETDENGNAIRDENGDYKVKSHTGNVFQRAGDWIKTKAWPKAKEITLRTARLKTHKEKVWMLKDGSGYYRKAGSGDTWEKCNSDGDVIADPISEEDMKSLVDSGLVTESTVSVDGTVKKKLKGLFKLGGETFGKLLKTKNELFTKIGEVASPFIDSIKEKGLGATIFGALKKTKKKGWYLIDGSGYYVMSSDKKEYEFFSMNGDKIESKTIDDSKMQELIDGGLVKEGDVIEDSEAKKAIDEIHGAVKGAWKSAKDTVKNGWDKFKKWIGGGGETVKDYTDDAKMGGNGSKSSFGGTGNRRLSRNLGYGGRGADSENGFAYYSQDDPRWKNQSYVSGVDDGATMGDSGCGPTAMAMVATQAANGSTISPTDMARAASESGFRDETGTNEKFIAYAGDSMGMSHTDVTNPSPAFIAQNASIGNPVVLNGVGNNGAFTPSGHYVVAVGTDDKGNVKVNDPRGKNYSKVYSPKELAKQTRKAWSFGGSGYMNHNYASKAANNFLDNKFGVGTKADGLDWLSIVQSVKQAIAAKQLGYSQSNFTDITLNGRTLNVRTDCSGFVGACLKFYDAIPENANITSSALIGSQTIGSKFSQMQFPGWDACQPGDILVTAGHTEIFAGSDPSGAHWVWNCGSDSSCNNPGKTRSSRSSYTHIWRPDNAGTGNNVVAIDGTGTAGSTDASGVASGGTTNNSSSGGFTDILSRVGGVFTKFASKAMDGLLTGNWNFDFSDSANGGSTSGSSSGGVDGGTSSGGSVVAASVNAGEEQKSIWDYFIGQGLTKEGTAGLMGNLEQESGNHAIRLQGDMAPPYAKSQEYTQAADSGTNNFTSDSKGYGLAQWTSSGRKEGLLNAAKSNNTSVGHLGTQLAFLNHELNTGYKPVLDVLKSASDVKTASDAVLHKFEQPADQSPSVENARASLGQGYYDKFANSTSANVTVTDGSQYASSAAQNMLQGKYGTGDTGTGGFGGFGKRKKTIRQVFGGRGAESNPSAQLSDIQTNRLQEIPTSKTTIQNTSINTTSLEQLLQNVLQVLQSIDGNTSKIENLSGGNYQSVNNGGNVIVSNDNSSQISNSVKDNLNAMMPKSSTNSQLAQQIARGR